MDQVGCSLCRHIPEEHEPRLVPYKIGALAGLLCGACQTKVDRALMPIIRAAAERVLRDETAFIAREEKDAQRAEVDAERERLEQELAEARQRQIDLVIANRKARREREDLIQRARKLKARLEKRGVESRTAAKRAAAHYGLRSSALMDQAA